MMQIGYPAHASSAICSDRNRRQRSGSWADSFDIQSIPEAANADLQLPGSYHPGGEVHAIGSTIYDRSTASRAQQLLTSISRPTGQTFGNIRISPA